MSESWRTVAQPSTPAQINKFFDACVAHILQPNDDDDQPVSIETTTPIDDVVDAAWSRLPSLGITDEEVALAHRRPCVFACGRSTSRTVVANPFCRAYMMAVCEQCSAQQSSS